MGITPRQLQPIIQTHYAHLQFTWFVRDNGVELNGETAQDNIEIFRKALNKAPKKNAELIRLLDAIVEAGTATQLFKSEKEDRKEQSKKRVDIETKLSDIEEGERYIYVDARGRLEEATVVTCDSCGRFHSVNSVGISGPGLRPVKVLEGLEELAGYNEETHRAECNDCHGMNYKTNEEALAGIKKQKASARKKKKA